MPLPLSNPVANTIFQVLDSLQIVDPHTHIQPLQPASRHLNDLLGYHYYTELAHSAGIPKMEIEADFISADDRVRRLVRGLGPLGNTVQLQWLLEIAQDLFGFDEATLTSENCDKLSELIATKTAAPNWADEVLDRCGVTAVMLTNDFDDTLENFDTQRYLPCLRADELVFHLHRSTVRSRLEHCTQQAISSLNGLQLAIDKLFQFFVTRGARACAISLPTDFQPIPISSTTAKLAWEKVVKADGEGVDPSALRTIGQFIFWMLADRCDHHKLPFDLMIGVHRKVYPQGVYQGQDLYDSRVSLYDYRALFNAFPDVYFPISVLASVTNQELVSYAWIFPNVLPFGHWWYSNTPSMIRRDLSHRLEAVPSTKLIGYYSDAYKLEFILPKFRMYKRVLAQTLAEDFVAARNWSEERAIQLGTQVLKSNSERYF
jgi:glucuronate isomerase